MKLWDKGVETEKLIEKFTIGKDNELDLLLARYDVLGTIAHIRMLKGIGLLSEQELKKSEANLQAIFDAAAKQDLHLALIRLPVTMFPDLAADQEYVLCLRSVLMKPEHEQWVEEIYNRLIKAAVT